MRLLLARDLGYLDRVGCEKLAEQTVEVKRMLTGFIQYLNNSQTGDRRSKDFLRADG